MRPRQPAANLIVRPEKLGDLVVATPVIRAFKETYPDQPLHLLTDDVYADAVRDDPHLDKIITMRWKARTAPHRDSYWSIYRKMAGQPYERAALLYYNCEKLNWLMAALRVREVAQLGGTVSAYLFGHTQVRRRGNAKRAHYSTFYLRVAEALGARTASPWPQLYLAEEEKAAFRRRFPFLEEKKTRMIVHPFGHGSAPNYSLAAYVRVMEMLAEDSSLEIFVTGTAKEKAQWEPYRHLPVRTDWLGELNVREWMAAATEAALVMCGSTGVIHVAAALNRPTLGVYCPYIGSSPDIWGPLGRNVHLLVVPENLCKAIQPCDSGCTKSVLCDLSFAVKPETVTQKAREVLVAPPVASEV